MRQIIIFLFTVLILFGCAESHYNISIDGFESNRKIWGLTISELEVDSLNQKGFPAAYVISNSVDAGQMGDHEYDDPIKEYGYNWEPQKKIPFNRSSRYYSWRRSGEIKQYDTLPLIFKKNAWYLLTNWQPSSAGGGKYNLFVFVTETGEFVKHFDIQTGPW